MQFNWAVLHLKEKKILTDARCKSCDFLEIRTFFDVTSGYLGWVILPDNFITSRMMLYSQFIKRSFKLIWSLKIRSTWVWLVGGNGYISKANKNLTVQLDRLRIFLNFHFLRYYFQVKCIGYFIYAFKLTFSCTIIVNFNNIPNFHQCAVAIVRSLSNVTWLLCSLSQIKYEPVCGQIYRAKHLSFYKLM